MCVYIPSNEILFKLMKACIGCDKIEDLWIFNKKYDDIKSDCHDEDHHHEHYFDEKEHKHDHSHDHHHEEEENH